MYAKFDLGAPSQEEQELAEVEEELDGLQSAGSIEDRVQPEAMVQDLVENQRLTPSADNSFGNSSMEEDPKMDTPLEVGSATVLYQPIPPSLRHGSVAGATGAVAPEFSANVLWDGDADSMRTAPIVIELWDDPEFQMADDQMEGDSRGEFNYEGFSSSGMVCDTFCIYSAPLVN
ncbi:hypothetical protein WOLCODRAFT_148491 [Wolfiporia cocos MD-104 SS10]|uniref:Uncharacterized protein n=1 Tax=Wolfiporia cocos (strain MD-104) TaxID=742152 RepID=A0A2H3IWW1_WOLCO|nr:hypothetical protein WOLCODRAFT_148491 [Wolfiporia cocos MD-104 SS10]